MPISEPTTDHSEIRHWALKHKAVPVEVLPDHVDSEPATLRFLLPEQSRHLGFSQISWEEFFVKFDELGLTFVYDKDSTGYNEILQVESRSPYRNPAYRGTALEN